MIVRKTWLVFGALLTFSVALPYGDRLRSQAGEDLPGDEARVAYEMGFSYLLAEDPDQARDYLEAAIAAGGPYADLARTELVRLQAYAAQPAESAQRAEADEEAVLAAIRQTLLGFEDRTRIPRAWFGAVQALDEAGRYASSLKLAMELTLRYPESPWADDALLTAARLHAANGHHAAALESLFRILKDHAAGDRSPAAAYMLARIYSSPGEYYSPGRACAALESLRLQQGVPTPVHQAARDFYSDYCLY